MGTVTRASARLRNVQPEVNLDRDYEGLKKPKKTLDAVCSDSAADKSQNQDSDQEMASAEAANSNSPAPCSADGDKEDQSVPPIKEASEEEVSGDCSRDEEISSLVESVKGRLMERTENYRIPEMERLYTRIMKGVLETLDKGLRDEKSPKHSILRFLSEFGLRQANF